MIEMVDRKTPFILIELNFNWIQFVKSCKNAGFNHNFEGEKFHTFFSISEAFLTCTTGFALSIVPVLDFLIDVYWDRNMLQSLQSDWRWWREWSWTTWSPCGDRHPPGCEEEEDTFLLLAPPPARSSLQVSTTKCFPQGGTLQLALSLDDSLLICFSLSDFRKCQIFSLLRSRGNIETYFLQISGGTAWRDSSLWSQYWGWRR